MATEWYVFSESGPLGPLTAAELRRMAADGSLLPSSLIGVDRKVWKEARAVRGLEFPVDKSGPPPLPDERIQSIVATIEKSQRRSKPPPLPSQAGANAPLLFSTASNPAPPTPMPSTVPQVEAGSQPKEGQATRKNSGTAYNIGGLLVVVVLVGLICASSWLAPSGSKSVIQSAEEFSGFTLVQVSPAYSMVMRDEVWDSTKEGNLSDRERADMLWHMRGRFPVSLETIPAPAELRRPIGWSQRLTKSQFARMTSGR